MFEYLARSTPGGVGGFGSLKIVNLEIESWKYDIRKCGNWKLENYKAGN